MFDFNTPFTACIEAAVAKVVAAQPPSGPAGQTFTLQDVEDTAQREIGKAEQRILDLVRDNIVRMVHSNIVGTLTVDEAAKRLAAQCKIGVADVVKVVVDNLDHDELHEAIADKIADHVSTVDVCKRMDQDRLVKAVASHIDADDIAEKVAEEVRVDEDKVAECIADNMDTDDIAREAASTVAENVSEDDVVERAAEMLSDVCSAHDVAQAMLRKVQKGDMLQVLSEEFVKSQGLQTFMRDTMVGIVRAEIAAADAARRSQPLWRRMWNAIRGI